MLLFWLFASISILLALASLRGDRRRADYTAEALAREPATLPPATVIVPVKGHDHALADNLEALASLHYPDFELLVVARSESDVPAGVIPARARVVFAGHGDPNTGEKINNLLAAIAAARPESQIFAFADSDGRVQPGWLRALAAALEQDKAGAATAYRWHLPQPPSFWSLLRSVWNSVIAGNFGPGDNPFAWGGAMAIRRGTFHSARIAEYWQGAVSDDFRLSQAIHDAGLRIIYAPGALVVSSDQTSAAEFLSWIKRQMIITRVYHPRLWWMAILGHIVYCGAMALSVWVAATGSTLIGEYTLVTLLGLGMLKGTNRASIAKSALPTYKTWFDRHGWVFTWWVPLGTWVWLYGLLASCFTNTIEWRGNRYRISSGKTRKLYT
ncbi:MAG: glycosyltransferase [Acidimicrobiia bacterium]|nr:glycosyltransferase [Acidimicrobiia bacterium]